MFIWKLWLCIGVGIMAHAFLPDIFVRPVCRCAICRLFIRKFEVGEVTHFATRRVENLWTGWVGSSPFLVLSGVENRIVLLTRLSGGLPTQNCEKKGRGR